MRSQPDRARSLGCAVPRPRVSQLVDGAIALLDCGHGSRHRPPRRRAAALPYFDGDDETKARGLFQLLREDGTPVDEAALAGLDRALARRLFEGMLRIRVTDARMMALQRQGRIGFYGEAMGQEAAIVGSAAASEPARLDRARRCARPASACSAA